jgi:DNA-binding response OmpR family regulator
VSVILGSFSAVFMSRCFPGSVFLSARYCIVACEGRGVQLTRLQFWIISLLASHGGIVSNREIFEMLYGEDEDGGPENWTAVVAEFIRRVRVKLAVLPRITIRNAHGRGYWLEVAEKARARAA